jgi:hypothetical protein
MGRRRTARRAHEARTVGRWRGRIACVMLLGPMDPPETTEISNLCVSVAALFFIFIFLKKNLAGLLMF